MRWRRILLFCWLAVAVPVFVFGVWARPGTYSGQLGITVFPDPEVWFTLITIKAETQPRWCWQRPLDHRYTNASLDLSGPGEAILVAVDLSRET